jgi:hypothetical protein
MILLAVGLVASTAVAIVEYVQLRAARAEIEELEARLAQGKGGSGGILGDLGEIFEDAFGELGEGPGGGTGPGELLRCLLPQEPFSAPPIGDVAIEDQVRAIAGQVERIRRLEFTEPVDPEFVTADASAARVRDLFLDEYTEAIGEAEARVLTALGAIPSGTNLRGLRAQILGQQVAGFYDPETGELVVRQAGAELTLTDRVVLAHELDHALTDQALGLPVPDDIRTGREDADQAVTALIEGDATLVMQLYAASVPFGEQLQGLDPSALAEAIRSQEGLAALPPYLQRELAFPYEEGLAFVCDLYQEGGWAAVDQAYRNPPDSTAEILFPERYRAGESPLPTDVPGELPAPWQRTGEHQLGAAQLLWLFQAPGGDPAQALPDAREAAGEWAGGTVELWGDGPGAAMGIALADRPGGASLCQAVAEWYRRAFDDDAERRGGRYELASDGPTQDALVACLDDETRLAIAPDLETAAGLIG